MGTSLGEFKSYYNGLIKKHKKAMVWLDSPTVLLNKKMEWLDSGKYKELTIELSSLIEEYTRLTGKEITESEMLGVSYGQMFSLSPQIKR